MHVRTGQDREPDRIGVLLERRGNDLLRGLPKAGVDHLHARITQGAGDDLGPAIVAVETRLGDDDSDFAHK